MKFKTEYELIHSDMRNTHFGTRKDSLGRVHEWDEGRGKSQITGRVHGFGHAFTRKCPCGGCGWTIDYCESMVRIVSGARIIYYHPFCFKEKYKTIPKKLANNGAKLSQKRYRERRNCVDWRTLGK